MKQRITLAIVAVVALTAAAWTYGKAAPAPQKWEYLFETECNQVQANNLGVQGWELVAMDPSSSRRQCIYKRPMF
jgi:hypothetical protein